MNKKPGIEFLGWTRSNSLWTPAAREGEWTIYRSRLIKPASPWDELILSWNLGQDAQHTLLFRIVLSSEEGGQFVYEMGIWSGTDPAQRRSVAGQSDAMGEVQTDVLALRRPGSNFWIEVAIEDSDNSAPPLDIKFLGVCLTHSKFHPQNARDTESDNPLETAGDAAQSRIANPNSKMPINLPVPEKSQLWYQGGDGWCSPASLCMVLSYWSVRLGKPEWMVEVPRCAEQIHDPVWGGTGNWAFNAAFAGGLDGLRAYVTRLADVSELESWLRQGAPVICSVSSAWLQGKEERGAGHLLVCRGFTEAGDVIVNDPGTAKDIRRVYDREQFIHAWSASKNTVYIVHPVGHSVPKNEKGHWFGERNP